MTACVPPRNDSFPRGSGTSECAEVWPRNWSVTDALTSVEKQSHALALALSTGDDEAYEEAERAATTLALLRSPIRLSLRKPEDSDVAALCEKHNASSNVQSVEKAESEEIVELGRTTTLKVPCVEKAEPEEMESGATQSLEVAGGPESVAEAGIITPSAVPDADAAAPESKDTSDRDQKGPTNPGRLLLPRHVSIESSSTDMEKFSPCSESAAQRHPVGARVEYFSQTLSQWIPAIVQGFDKANGSYDLNVHPVAPARKVRALAWSQSKGNPWADSKDETRSSHLLGSCLQHHQPSTSSSCGVHERLPEGSAAEYHSATFGRWIPALVKGFTEETGTYVLDIQPVALSHKVRAATGTPPSHAATSAKGLSSLNGTAAMLSTSSLQRQRSSPRSCARTSFSSGGFPESPLDLDRARSNYGGGGFTESADECRCGLCQTSIDIEKLLFLQCEHFFCLPCLQSHVLRLNFVSQRVACPEGECSAYVTIPQIKEVIGAKAFSERHEKMLHEDEELARQLANEDEPFKCLPLTEGSLTEEPGMQRLRTIHASPEVAVTQLAQVAPVPRPKAKAAEHAQRLSKMDEEAAKALQEEFAREDAGGPSERQFDCPLCLLTHDRDEGIELDCQHRLCVTCFHAYLQSKITDAQVAEDELVCPIPDCKTEITTAQVEGGTHGTDLWDKFLSFRLKMWTPQEEDGIIVECPTPPCGRFVVPDGLQKVRCPVCAKEFCPKCMEDHSGSSCQAFQAWKAENSKADQNFEELMAHERWRRCPKCGAPSERESGCNFMQCRSAICRKHTYWCYVCGKELAKQDHYSHYPKGPYEDNCNTPEAERLVPALAQSWEGGSFGAAVEAVAAVGDAFRGWFKTPVGAA